MKTLAGEPQRRGYRTPKRRKPRLANSWTRCVNPSCEETSTLHWLVCLIGCIASSSNSESAYTDYTLAATCETARPLEIRYNGFVQQLNAELCQFRTSKGGEIMSKPAISNQEDVQRETLSYLPCAALSDHPLRMRFFSESHLERLIDAIRMHGLLQPLIVYAHHPPNYQILSGHYRIRAARRLHMKEVVCTIFQGSEEEALRIHCTANLLTRGLNPVEEAYLISELIRTRGMRMADIGAVLGHSKSWVSRRLKILRTLHPSVRRLVESGEIPPRFAQELTRLPQGNEQQRVWDLIRNQHLTKDSATSLVDWWLNATDTERAQMEEAPPQNPWIPCITDYAKRILEQCRRTLDQLAAIVQPCDALHQQWPQQEWSRLCATIRRLEQMVSGLQKGDPNAPQ